MTPRILLVGGVDAVSPIAADLGVRGFDVTVSSWREANERKTSVDVVVAWQPEGATGWTGRHVALLREAQPTSALIALTDPGAGDALKLLSRSQAYVLHKASSARTLAQLIWHVLKLNPPRRPAT